MAGFAAEWQARGADELIVNWVRVNQLSAVLEAAAKAGLAGSQVAAVEPAPLVAASPIRRRMSALSSRGRRLNAQGLSRLHPARQRRRSGRRLVIGAAFAAVVTSFVTNILTPLLGLLGVPDLTTWSYTFANGRSSSTARS
jgi:hypothetical protein